jgi:hypothetical protein
MQAGRIARGAALAGVLALAACDGGGGGGTGVEPGVLTVRLDTPAADDRAITLTVSGPGITGPAAEGAYLVHTRMVDGTLRAAVFGTLADGALLRFNVPDVKAASSYTATIVDVAAADNQLRGSKTGYTLTGAR